MNAEVETLKRENAMLLDALGQLVNKIEADEACGTPIHPQGHPDCLWLKDGGYPAQYRHARYILTKLSRSEEDE